MACAFISVLATTRGAVAAPSTANTPEPTPVAGFPDGLVELTATGGWIHFGRASALEDSAFFGGEMTHHFDFRHPRFAFAMSVAAEGSFSSLEGMSGGIDVILASVGFTLGLRQWHRVMPFLRGGPGFLVVDGEDSGLDVTGRFQFHVGGGVRLFATDWLVVRPEVRMFIHDNVQIGGGSGQFEDVKHWAFILGVGFLR